MTIDDGLLKLVDKMSRAKRTARSAFIREALKEDGLPQACAANFYNLQTLPKSQIGDRITRLSSRRMTESAAAVSFALALDED